MRKIAITNALDFILKEFRENHLRSADITAVPDGGSQASLAYDIPVTDVEYRNRITRTDKIRTEEIEIEYEDAEKTVSYLIENWNKFKHYQPSLCVAGVLVPGYGHVTLIREINGDDDYAEIHYINELESEVSAEEFEKNKSEQEKFELFIVHLKRFLRHIVLDMSNETNSSGIEKVAFERSLRSHIGVHDVTLVYYNDHEIKSEEFNHGESPNAWVSFYSELFSGLNMGLELSWKPSSEFNLYVTFSDKEGNSLKLFGEKLISSATNTQSLKLISNDSNPDLHVYHVTGNVEDLLL